MLGYVAHVALDGTMPRIDGKEVAVTLGQHFRESRSSMTGKEDREHLVIALLHEGSIQSRLDGGLTAAKRHSRFMHLLADNPICIGVFNYISLCT